MASSRLYVTLDQELLAEAKELISVTFNDGENLLGNGVVELDSVDLKNPYHLDLTSFLPNTRPLSLQRFFELTKELLDNSLSKAGQPSLFITEEYPPLDLATEGNGNDIIVYKIISREPAKMSADGMSRPQLRQKFSYAYQDPKIGDNTIEVFTRPLDHEIEFIVWSTSNKSANRVVEWLEKELVNNAWFFRSQGADRFYFLRRLSDGYITTGNQRLFYRPLRFFLRFSEFTAYANYNLKKVELEVSLTTGDN